MREVRACDFCGEGAAGVFEVLPAGVDGDARRMVLCADCQDTLDGVLAPLLDALGDRTGTGAGTTTGGGSGASDERPAETAATGAGGATESTDADRAETAATGAGGASTSTDTSGGGEDGEVHEAGGRPASARRGPPKGYSKVMRFLEGREFPMERERAEELAADAYGLERETVAAAIEHAKKHGRVREASGKLFR